MTFGEKWLIYGWYYFRNESNLNWHCIVFTTSFEFFHPNSAYCFVMSFLLLGVYLLALVALYTMNWTIYACQSGPSLLRPKNYELKVSTTQSHFIEVVQYLKIFKKKICPWKQEKNILKSCSKSTHNFFSVLPTSPKPAQISFSVH